MSSYMDTRPHLVNSEEKLAAVWFELTCIWWSTRVDDLNGFQLGVVILLPQEVYEALLRNLNWPHPLDGLLGERPLPNLLEPLRVQNAFGQLRMTDIPSQPFLKGTLSMTALDMRCEHLTAPLMLPDRATVDSFLSR